MQPVFGSHRGSFGPVPSCALNEVRWLLGKWWLFHSHGLRLLSARNGSSVDVIVDVIGGHRVKAIFHGKGMVRSGGRCEFF